MSESLPDLPPLPTPIFPGVRQPLDLGFMYTVREAKAYGRAYGLACYQAGRAAGLEEAAKTCASIAAEHRNIYKGRVEPIDRDRMYNPHTDGVSDGAAQCEDAIRTMKDKPS